MPTSVVKAIDLKRGNFDSCHQVNMSEYAPKETLLKILLDLSDLLKSSCLGCLGSLLKLAWPLCFQANKADAVTLDGGLVYEAGLDPNKLRPVAAEVYGTQAGEFSLETRKLG